MKLAVAIISKSEKINPLVLHSVSFAEEIMVVVDSSTKKSKTVGNTRYIYHPLNNDFASQRNFALLNTHCPWVLFIDDDEYVSTELAKEIQEITQSKYAGYNIKRIDVCFHQPLLHGETGHTKILRLAQKSAGKFVRPVHENWKIKGIVGELSSPLYHIKDSFIGSFIGRMIQYGDIDATVLTKEKKPFTFWRLFLNPKAKFIQNYFCRAGFLDGSVGLFLAYLMSVQSLTVRVFQWTKRN